MNTTPFVLIKWPTIKSLKINLFKSYKMKFFKFHCGLVSALKTRKINLFSSNIHNFAQIGPTDKWAKTHRIVHSTQKTSQALSNSNISMHFFFSKTFSLIIAVIYIYIYIVSLFQNVCLKIFRERERKAKWKNIK